MSRIHKYVFAVALVVVVPSLAVAAPCLPGTVAGYTGLGAAGCQIGASTFFDFLALPSFSGGTAINPSLVLVAPSDTASGPRLDFLFTGSASANQILGIAIGYSISGSPLSDAILSLSGAAASGDGVVTVVEDICLGGLFASNPSNCSTPSPVTLVVAQDSTGPTGPDTRTLHISSFFDVFFDLTLDGGLSGTATMGTPGAGNGTATGQYTRAAVPEPATVSLLACGLLALLACGHRRNRNHR
jgi:hypothetical protein